MTEPGRIAAVILAAGASTRFGTPKQLIRIAGRTMPEHVVEVARAAGLDPILVVLPPGIDGPGDAQIVVNDDPTAGNSRSIRLGLAALEPEVRAAAILLGDEPTLSLDVLQALLSEPDGGRPIVAATARGLMRPPVILRRDAFRLAEAAIGDEGLRRALAELPELVTTVEIGEHPPDIDTVEDLEHVTERCPGCHERFFVVPTIETHAYIGASSGCWQAFTELMAREYADPGYGVVHRHTVDAYAAQHPGEDGRRERQSVAVHLIGLCHWLEHGLTAAELNPLAQSLTEPDRDWPRLDPPPTYDMTVVDVLAAQSGDEHVDLTRRWAHAVWRSYAPYHDMLRAWATEAVQTRR